MKEKNIRCLTDSEIGSRLFPGLDCPTSTKMTGDTVFWESHCSSGNITEITGSITYQGASFKGVMTYGSPEQTNQRMVIPISGKRIGDCTQNIETPESSRSGERHSEYDQKQKNDSIDPVLDAELKADWEEMKKALAGLDIEKALSYFAEGSKASFRKQFKDLGNHLPKIVANMSSINLVKVTDDFAEYEFRSVHDGETHSQQVIFVRERDGSWRIRSF
jgi:hypothetical protein